jgi:hypothetical protein
VFQANKVTVAHATQASLVGVVVVVREHQIMKWVEVQVTKDMVVVLLFTFLVVQVGGWVQQVKPIVGVYQHKEGMEPTL